MSDEHCLPYRENLAAYALDALDAEDIHALEAHLADCQDCQSVLAEYQSVASGLLQSVPPQTPPKRVRRKLIARHPIPTFSVDSQLGRLLLLLQCLFCSA